MPGYTAQQVQTLQGYINGANAALAVGDNQNALNYIQLYYGSQTEIRGYANDAQQVVSNTGIFGKTANQEIVGAIGADRWASVSTNVAVDLANSDMGLIRDNPTTIPTANQIADYHADVFASNGIPLTAWGGAAAAAMGMDWSQGTLNANELSANLTQNVFAQNFTPQQVETALGKLEIAGFQSITAGTAGEAASSMLYFNALMDHFQNIYLPSVGLSDTQGSNSVGTDLNGNTVVNIGSVDIDGQTEAVSAISAPDGRPISVSFNWSSGNSAQEIFSSDFQSVSVRLDNATTLTFENGSFVRVVPNGNTIDIVQQESTFQQTSTLDFNDVLQSQLDVFAAGNSLLKYYDTQNTHPYTELDIDEDPTGKPTAVQATLDPAVQATVDPAVAAISAAASIGQVLGSAIGHALAPNNPFLSLAAGTVAGAIGQQLSQAIAKGGLSFDGSGMSIAGVFQNFNVTLEGAASGAVASFLTAEIGTALGLHGYGAQLFNAAVGGYLGSVLSQAVQIGLGNVVGDINWSAALSGSEIDISGAVGSILAHQLVTAHTQAGAIGGQLVGAIGSIVGLSVGQAIGMSLDIILPGVGSLIGTILGTWLGDLFGGNPAHPNADSTVDPSTYSYSGHVYFVGDGGNSATSNSMADAVSSVLNAYLTAVGGVALASSKQVHIGYQTYGPAGRFRFERRDRRKLSGIPFRARTGRGVLRGVPANSKRVNSMQAKCA